VNHVDMIPAHGSVSIKDDELFDSTGHTFGSTKVNPNRIELESSEHLWSIYSATMQ
jgi:hypothetical protein